MAHVLHSPSRRRSVGAGLAIVVALLVGSVAVAPSAWAGHSDVTAAVDCVDGQHMLDWSWTAYRHSSTEELPGFVAVEYSEDGSPVVVRTTSLVDVPHLTSGSTLLAPPPGATQVRVHVYAHWTGTTNLISWLDARTGWLPLPAPCEVDQVVEVPPPAVDETTTTTSTTVAAGVGGVSSTTVTTDPPAAVRGVSAERQAASASAQAPAAVAGQASVATQTLPNTGSSSGVLAAGAVMLIAIGGALVSASRRSLHTITVSSGDANEPR